MSTPETAAAPAALRELETGFGPVPVPLREW